MEQVAVAKEIGSRPMLMRERTRAKEHVAILVFDALLYSKDQHLVLVLVV
jgi:hypothetical protein